MNLSLLLPKTHTPKQFKKMVEERAAGKKFQQAFENLKSDEVVTDLQNRNWITPGKKKYILCPPEDWLPPA